MNVNMGLHFPPEILEMIFKNLSTVTDIVNCSNVCVHWKNVIEAMFKDKGNKYLVIFQSFCFFRRAAYFQDSYEVPIYLIVL